MRVCEPERQRGTKDQELIWFRALFLLFSSINNQWSQSYDCINKGTKRGDFFRSRKKNQILIRPHKNQLLAGENEQKPATTVNYVNLSLYCAVTLQYSSHY